MSNNFCGNSDLIKFIVVEPIQSISGDTYVTGFTYSNSNLTIFQNQGQLPLSVNLPIYNGNSWYIPSGTTVTVTSGFQYFVYGDMYIDGTLDLQLDSQLVVLNGNLILSGAGTIIGAGTSYVISLPDIHISGVTYNNDILSITETNGNVFTVIIPTFSGNTSGSCITDLYVQNLNSCSPLHIQPINNGNVYISENGGNVGIGTTNPISTLDVNGKITTTNFQMTSGATNSYVLTSDASGNAYWSVPFSGSSVDTYVTGFTYDSSNVLTISQNQGQPDLTVTLPPYITGFTDYYVTGGTYSNGTLTLDRQNGSLTITGFTTTFTGNTSGDCITDLFVSNVNSCSPLHIQPNNLGDVYIGENGGVNLGIGTSTPQHKVHISGDGFITNNNAFYFATTNRFISGQNYASAGAAGNNALLLYNSDGSNYYYVNGNSNDASHHFQSVANGQGTIKTDLIIKNNGNVGIGTSTPTETLEVSGKIKTATLQVISGATNGYILTSDSNGNTIWSSPSSLTGLSTTDYYVTGGTYSGGTLTLNRQNGSISISGFTNGGSSVDTYVTGFTYNSSNNLTISQNQGQLDLTVTLPPYITGFTDTYVTGGTYSSGTLTLNRQNGSVVITGITNNNGGGGSSGSLFYFNLSVPQSPYREISETPVTAIEQTSGVTIGAGLTSTITSFLTPSGSPNITNIPAGIWSFFLHSYKQNNNASFNIFCEVYVRTTGGTETLLISSDPEPITSNSPNPSMQVSDVFYSGTSLNSSDRILVKVRAKNTSNQSHNVTFVTEGTSHYSYLKTSFGGLSTITLQQAYNNSTSPEITTNVTLGGVQFKGGTGSDTDKNIIIENNSGVETAYITAGGDGVFNSLSATTISGGTYYGDGSNLTNIVTSITATSGLSGNSITGNVTIINTSPDQVVTLSGGTGVSVTGTYPNFTIINTLPEINYTSTINLFNYYNFI